MLKVSVPARGTATRPLLDSLTTRFAREQPTSPYPSRLRELFEKAPSIAVGELVPDFTLPELDGQPVALSSLWERYVLVDSWTSWCEPCRAENSHVLAAYQRFQNRGSGFTLFGVPVNEQPAA